MNSPNREQGNSEASTAREVALARECGAEDCFGNGLPECEDQFTLTESQLIAFVQRVEEDAYEAAAQVAERTYEGSSHGCDGDSGYDFDGTNSAEAIRKLKGRQS